jgi:hypothetical protein
MAGIVSTPFSCDHTLWHPQQTTIRRSRPKKHQTGAPEARGRSTQWNTTSPRALPTRRQNALETPSERLYNALHNAVRSGHHFNASSSYHNASVRPFFGRRPHIYRDISGGAENNWVLRSFTFLCATRCIFLFPHVGGRGGKQRRGPFFQGLAPLEEEKHRFPMISLFPSLPRLYGPRAAFFNPLPSSKTIRACGVERIKGEGGKTFSAEG